MGLLEVTVLLLLASYISADNTYVVLAPNTIRPGFSANIQYNLRDAAGDVTVVTEILQRNVVKFSSRILYRAGQMRTFALRVPATLKAGKATIKVKVTGSITHTSTAQVTVKAKSLSLFIQTDKVMYKPSQTVNFRVVAVDSRLMPYRGTCDIEIKDAEGNKIKLWKSLELESGVLTQKLELSDQPVLGDWKIQVTTDRGESQVKTITVDKYVLPKFEVSVNPPSFVLARETQIKVTIESKYTYGQGVDGTATVTVSNPGLTDWGYDQVARTYAQPRTVQFNNLRLIDGKVELTMTASQLQTLTHNNRGMQDGDQFTISANVTETLTGITQTEEAVVKIYSSAETLEFLSSSPTSFKPGFSYTGFLKLSQVDGTVVPAPNMARIKVDYKKLTEMERMNCCGRRYHELEQQLRRRNSGSVRQLLTKSYRVEYINVTFAENGLAKFSFDVPDVTTSIKLDATYGNKRSISDSKTLQETKSPSKSFVQLVLLTNQLQAGSQAMFRMTSTAPDQMVDYQIWSRGSMVTCGSVKVDSQSSFSVQMLASMAPSARIIAYYVASGNANELVADSLNFNVEGAFDRNQVTVTYSKEKAQPSESVDVQVTAVTGSLVGLLAVDQSVLLLAGGNDITQSDVLSELRSYDTVTKSSPSSSNYGYWYPYSVSGTDSSTILSNSGLVALTNALVYKHVERRQKLDCHLENIEDYQRSDFHSYSYRCPLYSPWTFNVASSGSHSFIDDLEEDSPVMPPIRRIQNLMVAFDTSQPVVATAAKVVAPKLRKVFPETWLWTNLTSYDGQVSITATVPDTITSWVASAFAVSSYAGLGVSSEAAKMQVFKPFFVSLNLPYSVVRGEQLVLQAILFNYMDRDVNVTVTLPASDEYRSIVVSPSGSTTNIKRIDVVTIKAKANQGTTVSFPIIPTIIGKMRVKVTAVAPGAADAVQRDLLVEAEGIEKEYNQAVLINLKNSSSFIQTVAIDFPPNIVSDSARVEFSVIGDIMGPSINGLDRLIKMPYGCGEQNMLNFAPTIFVTEYLTQTNQLTPELKSKSISFMEKGYQRELTYQRNDGSFSAFGQRDYSGSMWLTAFVAKSFQQAKTFIYVDEKTIQRAVDWIITRQLPDGSFPEPGRIICKEMLGGGASSAVTLTAFVLIAISEVQFESTEIAPRLTTAKLNAQRYLETRSSTLTDPYSLALTSYALFKSGSHNVDLTLGPLERLSIMKDGWVYWEQPQPQPLTNSRVWRPPHTQGRAVNIELAAYILQLKVERSGVASAIPILKWVSAQRNANGGFSSTQDTIVALQALAKFAKIAVGDTNMVVSVSAFGQTYDYSLTSTNLLVLQSRVLDSDVKSVVIDAAGTGVALAQISATYNIEEYEQEPAFTTKATVLNEKKNSITVQICTRWLLSGTTGMAVIEIGIPSGFSADIEGLEMKKYSGVKKIEEGDRKVILYLDEIGSDERCIDVDAIRTGLIAKARPVAVKIYDYYEPENQQTIFYSSTHLNNVNICDVCGATCEGCTAYFKRR